MSECDARADVGYDGLLWCGREPGHEGMHRGQVWWFPLPELDYIELPEPADRSIDPCPAWSCPDLSTEDRRDGKTCPEHPCTCAPEHMNRTQEER